MLMSLSPRKRGLHRTALAAAVIAALSSVAWAAGMWSTLPIVGGTSFCPGQTLAGPPGTPTA
jgi:hypothetical protein